MTPLEAIQHRIRVIRDHRVMLDVDLATLYDVPTGRLVEAVKRNIERFPDDFMFQLDANEFAILKSQSAISSDESPADQPNLQSQSAPSSGWGGRRTPPYAFSEQGVAMLSSVLRSERAVAVNIAIMRAFVQLRRVLDSHTELAHRLGELEHRMAHDQTRRDIRDENLDYQIAQIVEAIRQLMAPPPIKRRPVGFTAPEPVDPMTT
ncbi:MAG: ORF6N domain-containing protein [Thermoleophilia bacterium]|nr:ORF6N domain-containing protein [Thermoleophilia bacterium]